MLPALLKKLLTCGMQGWGRLNVTLVVRGPGVPDVGYPP
jgi:hypothetical protein